MAENEDNIYYIDRSNLHEELFRQADLYEKKATKLEEAKSDLDYAKNNLELVEAETDLKVRKDPNSFGIDRVSESSIKSAIALDKGVQKAKEEVLKIKRKVGIYSVAVIALDHKKKSLESAVTLFLNHYWSEPRLKNTKETVELRDDLEQEKRKKLYQKNR